METKLIDVIHHYLGCETTVGRLIEVRKSGHCTTYKDGKHLTGEINEVQLLLRPYSTMTDGEREEYQKMQFIQRASPVHHLSVRVDSPQSFDWLLKNSFDIFKLIETGQAIDKTKM